MYGATVLPHFFMCNWYGCSLRSRVPNEGNQTP